MGQAKIKLEIKTFQEYVYYLCVSNNRPGSIFNTIDEDGQDLLQMFVVVNGQDVLFEINEELRKSFIIKIMNESNGMYEEVSNKLK